MILFFIISIFIFSQFHAFSKEAVYFESEGVQLETEVIVEDLDIPWSFVFLPQGDILITEKKGRIVWHKKGAPPSQWSEVEGVPKVYSGGQGGLMDIVLHPRFSKKPWIYLTYSISQKGRKRTTRVSRALWKNGRLTNLEILFTAEPFFSTNYHFGSRLVFDDKGYIFFTVGDRGNRDLAQSLKTHNGKVMRLYDDGRIPKDNPFKNPFRKEIWSFGHRNPQGLVMKEDELWMNEHGPRGGDEVNLVLKGRNYGWPVVTYGKEYIGGSIGEGYTKKGMEDPKKYYIPSIAPSGMAYYDKEIFPFWKGSFFIGSLVLQHLNRISGENLSKEQRLLQSLGKRIRDVRVGPDRHIYLAVEKKGLLKIKLNEKKTF